MVDAWHGLAMETNVTIVWFLPSTAFFCFIVSALGVTAGAHRLWSHRSYKASLPLKIFLATANSMSFQVSKHSDAFSQTQDERRITVVKHVEVV